MISRSNWASAPNRWNTSRHQPWSCRCSPATTGTPPRARPARSPPRSGAAATGRGGPAATPAACPPATAAPGPPRAAVVGPTPPTPGRSVGPHLPAPGRGQLVDLQVRVLLGRRHPRITQQVRHDPGTVPQTPDPARTRDVGSGRRLRYTSSHRGTLRSPPIRLATGDAVDRPGNERLRAGAAPASDARGVRVTAVPASLVEQGQIAGLVEVADALVPSRLAALLDALQCLRRQEVR